MAGHGASRVIDSSLELLRLQSLKDRVRWQHGMWLDTVLMTSLFDMLG